MTLRTAASLVVSIALLAGVVLALSHDDAGRDGIEPNRQVEDPAKSAPRLVPDPSPALPLAGAQGAEGTSPAALRSSAARAQRIEASLPPGATAALAASDVALGDALPVPPGYLGTALEWRFHPSNSLTVGQLGSLLAHMNEFGERERTMLLRRAQLWQDVSLAAGLIEARAVVPNVPHSLFAYGKACIHLLELDVRSSLAAAGRTEKAPAARTADRLTQVERHRLAAVTVEVLAQRLEDRAEYTSHSDWAGMDRYISSLLKIEPQVLDLPELTAGSKTLRAEVEKVLAIAVKGKAAYLIGAPLFSFAGAVADRELCESILACLAAWPDLVGGEWPGREPEQSEVAVLRALLGAVRRSGDEPQRLRAYRWITAHRWTEDRHTLAVAIEFARYGIEQDRVPPDLKQALTKLIGDLGSRRPEGR